MGGAARRGGSSAAAGMAATPSGAHQAGWRIRRPGMAGDPVMSSVGLQTLQAARPDIPRERLEGTTIQRNTVDAAARNRNCARALQRHGIDPEVRPRRRITKVGGRDQPDDGGNGVRPHTGHSEAGVESSVPGLICPSSDNLRQLGA